MVKGIPNHCLSSWAAVLRAGTGFRAFLRLTEFRRPRQPYVHPPHIGVVACSKLPPAGQQVAQHQEFYV